jgi:hypothetical protein
LHSVGHVDFDHAAFAAGSGEAYQSTIATVEAAAAAAAAVTATTRDGNSVAITRRGTAIGMNGSGGSNVQVRRGQVNPAGIAAAALIAQLAAGAADSVAAVAAIAAVGKLDSDAAPQLIY